MFLFNYLMSEALRLTVAVKKRTKTVNSHAAAGSRVSVTKPDVEDDNWDDEYESGRSPNDDRSDSMNPNNDAYQAAMDNHANQMNPNNAAYHSSRGGGRK